MVRARNLSTVERDSPQHRRLKPPDWCCSSSPRHVPSRRPLRVSQSRSAVYATGPRLTARGLLGAALLATAPSCAALTVASADRTSIRTSEAPRGPRLLRRGLALGGRLCAARVYLALVTSRSRSPLRVNGASIAPGGSRSPSPAAVPGPGPRRPVLYSRARGGGAWSVSPGMCGASRAALIGDARHETRRGPMGVNWPSQDARVG